MKKGEKEHPEIAKKVTSYENKSRSESKHESKHESSSERRVISKEMEETLEKMKEGSPDIFGEDIEESPTQIEEPKEKQNNQVQFDNIVTAYLLSDPYKKTDNKTAELEVRFGTRGIKQITKNDYDNVIRKLKSIGFSSLDENGINRLTIKNQFLDENDGRFKMSNIRTEIHGISQIQKYCKTNDIEELVRSGFQGLSFVKKYYERDQAKKPYVANFDDFNFRIAYEIEESYMSKSGKNSIESNRKRSLTQKGKSKGPRPDVAIRNKIIHSGKTISDHHKEVLRNRKGTWNHSVESIEKIRIKNKKPKTDIAKLNMSIAWLHKKDITCPHCNKSSKNMANMKRWHFDNCKNIV
jgi:hypothetical protein